MTRKSGTYSLEELVSDVDGTLAYQNVCPDVAGSWDMAGVEVDADIQWSAEVDDESDDLDIAMTLEAYADLVTRAKRHCDSCSGCAR